MSNVSNRAWTSRSVDVLTAREPGLVDRVVDVVVDAVVELVDLAEQLRRTELDGMGREPREHGAEHPEDVR
jgi:hypothetical protein